MSVELELKRALRRLSYATVGLYVVVALMLFVTWSDSRSKSEQIAKEAERTTTALCAFRHDLEARVDATTKFLVEHPEGFSGIPVASIRSSLEGQQRTIRVLLVLDCKPPS